MDTSQPFTSAQARRTGIGRKALAGKGFRRLFHGVYVSAETDVTLPILVKAALLVLPPDAAVSHSTAMRVYGFSPRRPFALEFSTNTAHHRRLPGIVVHRRKGFLHPREIDGLWTLGPDRTFVDVATRTALPELVAFGDLLVHRGLTTPDDLLWYAQSRHLDGVQRARRIAPLVRSGAESPPESFVRLMTRFARLPEPEPNVNIFDDFGRFLARGDLVFRRWKVVVEYDGRHHLRDPHTWQRDLRRREQLEAAGWTVIVITHDDMSVPASIPSRVHHALVAHGYAGPAPVLSWQWSRWFAPTPQDLRANVA